MVSKAKKTARREIIYLTDVVNAQKILLIVFMQKVKDVIKGKQTFMLDNVAKHLQRYFTGTRLQKLSAGLLETLAIQTKLAWINPLDPDDLFKNALNANRTGGEVRILNSFPWDKIPIIFNNFSKSD